MLEKTILILGGVVGGIAAANRLRKELGKRIRIVLVDRKEKFSLAASYLWVMTGDRKPRQISRPLSGLQRRGIEVVKGEVEHIDIKRRNAVVSGKTYAADYIIIALGAEFAPQNIPGLEAEGLTFCTLDGAIKLREALAAFRSGRILLLTAAPAYKCPAAPYEAAMLVESALRKRGRREAVDIQLHTAEPAPMGVAGPNVSAAVQAMVESKNIAYRPSHQISRVENRQVHFTDGDIIDFDLLIYVPPIAPPDCLSESGLELESGWVKADRRTMETNSPQIYAIGDVTMIPLTMGKPLPKAGVFAHGQAETVARNIARRVRGVDQNAQFDGRGACFIETGDRRAGFGAGDFYAEPAPQIKMRKPGWIWHSGKALFEKQVMWRWL